MPQVNPLRGITFRVALLGWVVTLITLAVFLVVSVPQQASEFRTNLESKARGVAASIKGVAAGAAVSEDYSAVVDQAMQVLAGDEAIDFVVITKNDGFSVVTDRSNWRTETLNEMWRPATRASFSSIHESPLFKRRVFHYATPFDYSGVEWGWVHIGLSLDAYDQSVSRSYARTLVLTLICIALSLLASLYFARRLVRPIRALHGAVEKVAAGNMEARAPVRTSDEIGRLAGAFNTMTATILARNRILESVSFAAQELLEAPDWPAAMREILERLGLALGSCRAYIFQNETHNGRLCCSLRRAWMANPTLVTATAEQWQRFPWRGGAFEKWGEQLGNNEIVEATVSSMDPAQRSTLSSGTRSIILIPVVVGNTWWGFLGFDDCVHEREWGQAEKECLRAVANTLGSAIIRRRTQDALLEANDSLERRVVERTQELREQMTAKELAHAELAAAQQRLVDLSRQAGMAEVATGVLHNVGNVLNSVNVATTLMLEKVERSRIDKLATVAELLQKNEPHLSHFLGQDPKGSQIVPYLIKLSEHLSKERDGMMSELGNLSRHVGHIKEIVAAQQGYAMISGFVEQVSIRKLMEDALALSRHGLEHHGVRLTTEVADLPEVLIDKHKVLQIVLNLIRNAKDATCATDDPVKEIRLRVVRLDESRFEISVSDNGVGLRSEDLRRVFQHGFTTKAGGHGFGLHSGALAAKDLGGKLEVHSDGPGMGATFRLELPLRVNLKKGARFTNDLTTERNRA
jgi:two-component system NtrC family sensor kinase